MSEPEEQGFEIVDKRRLSEDGSAKEQPSGAVEVDERDSEAEASASEITGNTAEAPGEQGEAGEEALGPPDVAGLLAYMLNLLAAAAWQWMGVIMNPETGQAVTDLAQSRLAIDTFEVVASKLTPFLDERTNREVQNALADLRVNFVERSSRAPSGGVS